MAALRVRRQEAVQADGRCWRLAAAACAAGLLPATVFP